ALRGSRLPRAAYLGARVAVFGTRTLSGSSQRRWQEQLELPLRVSSGFGYLYRGVGVLVGDGTILIEVSVDANQRVSDSSVKIQRAHGSRITNWHRQTQ